MGKAPRNEIEGKVRYNLVPRVSLLRSRGREEEIPWE